MKPMRVAITSSLIAAVILFIFLVPLPVSRVRQTAMIQVHPDAATRVFLPEPAVLRQLLVRDGDTVHKDQPLAEFISRELETQLIESKAQFYIRSEELRALDKQKAEIFDAAERSKVEVRLAEARTAKARHEKEIEHLEARKQKLLLLAPIDGVVMGPPLVDHIGRRWEEKDLVTPVFTIGDPNQLRAWMPVSPDDYNLLSEDMKKTDDLEVTLRVQGHAERTWRGKMAPLPESEAAEIPLQLTNKSGGPIAVKPSSQPGHYVPQSQQYLVFVDILEPKGAIAPGTMAQVKVHLRHRTTAWWIWRTVSNMFDLKLNFGL